MNQLLACLFIVTSSSFCSSYEIGLKIWHNESGKSREKLAFWSIHEPFPSLGIGHFIWFPKDYKGSFVQTFPELLDWLRVHKIKLPTWLLSAEYAPWQNRDEFYADIVRLEELRELLIRTINLQADFMVQRLVTILPELYRMMSSDKRKNVQKIVQKMLTLPQGRYALVDYLNFKGHGMNTSERYQGKGWGLLQVLEQMPCGGTKSAAELINNFADAASWALQTRVALSVPERGESRFLPGWLHRINTYRITKA